MQQKVKPLKTNDSETGQHISACDLTSDNGLGRDRGGRWVKAEGKNATVFLGLAMERPHLGPDGPSFLFKAK